MLLDACNLTFCFTPYRVVLGIILKLLDDWVESYPAPGVAGPWQIGGMLGLAINTSRKLGCHLKNLLELAGLTKVVTCCCWV